MATIDSLRYVLLDNKLELKNMIESSEPMNKKVVEIILVGIQDTIMNKKLSNELIKYTGYLIEIKQLLNYTKELYPRIRFVDDLVDEINYIILFSEIVDFHDLIKFKSSSRFHPDDIEDVDLLDYVDDLNDMQDELLQLSLSDKRKKLIPNINYIIVSGLTLHIKKINRYLQHIRGPLDDNMISQLIAIKTKIRYMKTLSEHVKESLYYKIDRLLEHNRSFDHKKHKKRWTFWNGGKLTRKNRK